MAASGGVCSEAPEETKVEEAEEGVREAEEGEGDDLGRGEGQASESLSGSDGDRSEQPSCSGGVGTADGSGPTSPLGEQSVTSETSTLRLV